MSLGVEFGVTRSSPPDVSPQNSGRGKQVFFPKQTHVPSCVLYFRVAMAVSSLISTRLASGKTARLFSGGTKSPRMEETTSPLSK